ncbi:MAG: SpvB/TcaC N-terminal domain-containing protein [Nannocystaceae bacterium]
MANRPEPEARVAPLVPKLELPRGGGAIRGIDEKVASTPHTGSLGVTIGLPTTPGRALTPELSLRYDSGTGNGPFGAGFALDVPSVSRRTNKGVPRYDASDVFALPGADDLVPALVETDGAWGIDERIEDGYRVRRHRPRVEQAYSRIEHWVPPGGAGSFWKVTTSENVTHVFGTTAGSRAVDPDAPTRVFRWALDETRDDRGNTIKYEWTNAHGSLYLARVQWGNLAVDPEPDDFVFELRFEYGERADPFSSHRSGFEIRTTQLCRRVALFHRVTGPGGLGDAPVLVRSLDLEYDEHPALAHLLIVRGWAHGEREILPLPPMQLSWTSARVDSIVRTLDAASGDPLPLGIDGPSAWVDLAGEGLSGALYESGRGWHWARNLGAGRFAPIRALPVQPHPSLVDGLAFGDPEQRGQTALVAWSGVAPGYRYTDGTKWEPWHALPPSPAFEQDPHARMLDVDGDGLPDLVVTEHEALRIYPSRGGRGFGPGQLAPYPTDEHGPPAFVFGDGDESIFLADMSGDGLTDVVRIRNRQVCYWPNRGHGRFGGRVVVHLPAGHAFDSDEGFDPSRLRLADVDGSGPTDIVYLGGRGITLWRNLAGNRFAPPEHVPGPAVDALSRITIVDIEGDGTGCLVWSTALAADHRPSIRYVRLSRSADPAVDRSLKPHLLAGVDNGLGARSEIEYGASTAAYIADERAGRPWATRLPMPVHVVTRITRVDEITGARHVTRFAHHHGCWDPVEREFRGFGMVEQWDADEYDAKHRGDPMFVPPAHTKTWTHVGVLGRESALLEQFRGEWYAGLPTLASDEITDRTDAESVRLATRALGGRGLRDEVYADDAALVGEEVASRPFVVRQHRWCVRMLQPGHAGHPPCFAVDALESLECHTERLRDDARISHTLQLEYDRFGHPLVTASVAYGRGGEVVADDEQRRTHVHVALARVGNVDEEPTWYRLGVPLASTTWEIVDAAAPIGPLYTAAELRPMLHAGRLIAAEVKLYQADTADDTPLAPDVFESRALPYESYRLAFTAAHLDALAAVTRDGGAELVTLLEGDAGYASRSAPVGSDPLAWLAREHEEGTGYWIPSGRALLDPLSFYTPFAFVDPWGARTDVKYDEATRMLLVELEAPAAQLGEPRNRTRVTTIDYRHMAAAAMEDPNGSRVELAFDARGAVIARAVVGTPLAPTGDSLEVPTETFAYQFDVLPASARTRSRRFHGVEAFEEAVALFDGFGRTLVTKVSADPGVALSVVGDAVVEAFAAPRWIGSGRVRYDNKGEAVQTFEPYFSATDGWEDDVRLDAVRPSSVVIRDALGRVMRTTHEDGTFAEVRVTPWSQEAWDENDTAEVLAGRAGTPGVAHFDALGRTIAQDDTIAAGRVARTRTEYDAVGDPRVVRNPLGHPVRTYVRDLARRVCVEHGVDDGQSVKLLAADDQPLRTRTANGHVVATTYDRLRRATATHVRMVGGTEFPASRTWWGEGAPDAERDAANLRGRAWRVLDPAGEITTHYDSVGNAVEVVRRIFEAPGEGAEVDVDAAVLSAEAFATRTSFDARGRALTVSTTPDPRVQSRGYGLDGRLARVTVDGLAVATIEHDASGRRKQIAYGNGVVTTYEYDPARQRLVRLLSKRGATTHQDLSYTYDLVGNVKTIVDASQPAVTTANEVVTARSTFEYDGLYRLVTATGREHRDQAIGDQRAIPEAFAAAGDTNDMQRLTMYEERYVYDDAGNISRIEHDAGGQTRWVRQYTYDYEETDGRVASNRLSATTVPGHAGALQRYIHDDAGNMEEMVGLASMTWDWRNAMVRWSTSTDTQALSCTYDGAGQRVTKWSRGAATSTRRTVRIYLGGLEIYREIENGEVVLERRSLQVMDDERRIVIAEHDEGPQAIGSLVRYQLENHLGSCSVELGGVGFGDAQVLSHEEFHPYGTTAYSAASSMLEGRPKRYRFTGMERDQESGLQVHGVRYYAVWLGRWVSADPIGIAGGVNPSLRRRQPSLMHRQVGPRCHIRTYL